MAVYPSRRVNPVPSSPPFPLHFSFLGPYDNPTNGGKVLSGTSAVVTDTRGQPDSSGRSYGVSHAAR
jgi:hypothetical protein